MKLLLDANLATLLVVGASDSSFIGRHKRLRSYEARDYDALARFIATFETILFVPNVLTEVSNLAFQGVQHPLRGRIVEKFRLLIEASAEVFVGSRIAVRRPEFERLGLTDAALLERCSSDTLLLTHDGGLFAAACKAGLQAESFERLRVQR